MGTHLFAESIIGCKKPIALAVDGWISTPSNGIHFPMGVVIVYHMEVSMSTSASVKQILQYNQNHDFTSITDHERCIKGHLYSKPSTIQPTWILKFPYFSLFSFTLAFFGQALLQSDWRL